MKIVAVRVGQPPVIEELDNTLEAMHDFVGGYIEVLPLTRDGLVLVCNEEGKINSSKANRKLPHGGDVIFGDFFICETCGEEFRSILEYDPELVRKYVEGWRQYD